MKAGTDESDDQSTGPIATFTELGSKRTMTISITLVLDKNRDMHELKNQEHQERPLTPIKNDQPNTYATEHWRQTLEGPLLNSPMAVDVCSIVCASMFQSYKTVECVCVEMKNEQKLF